MAMDAVASTAELAEVDVAPELLIAQSAYRHKRKLTGAVLLACSIVAIIVAILLMEWVSDLIGGGLLALALLGMFGGGYLLSTHSHRHMD